MTVLTRLQLVLLILACLAVVLLGGLMFMADRIGWLMAILAVGFFGYGLVVFSWLLIAPESYIRLTGAKFQIAGRKSVNAASRVRRPAADPFPIITASESEVLATIARLRAEGAALPVAIGDDAALAAAREAWRQDRRKPATIIAAAARQKTLGEEVAANRRLDPEWELPAGRWPSETPAYEESLHGISDKPLVHIAMLPVEDPSEAPAWLKFGGFNGCPPPERHVAILRRWREEYGAELMACGPDSLTLRVSRGPASRKEAIDLARQLCAYADYDLNNYSELAAELMATRLWYFWWD